MLDDIMTELELVADTDTDVEPGIDDIIEEETSLVTDMEDPVIEESIETEVEDNSGEEDTIEVCIVMEDEDWTIDEDSIILDEDSIIDDMTEDELAISEVIDDELSRIVELLNAETGVDMSIDDCIEVGSADEDIIELDGVIEESFIDEEYISVEEGIVLDSIEGDCDTTIEDDILTSDEDVELCTSEEDMLDVADDISTLEDAIVTLPELIADDIIVELEKSIVEETAELSIMLEDDSIVDDIGDDITGVLSNRDEVSDDCINELDIDSDDDIIDDPEDSSMDEDDITELEGYVDDAIELSTEDSSGVDMTTDVVSIDETPEDICIEDDNIGDEDSTKDDAITEEEDIDEDWLSMLEDWTILDDDDILGVAILLEDIIFDDSEEP